MNTTDSNTSVATTGETFEFAAVDACVKYPSYKSFDEFVDIDRLRSLDGYIRQRIKRHIVADNE